MAYGTSEGANKRFLNFKITTQETVDGKKVKVAQPYFSVDSKGEDGKYHSHPDKPRFVAGNLTKIKLGSFKYEDDDIQTVQLYLEDGNEIYNVDLRYNLVARNIFNALLNLETYENLKFELYTNKKGYPAVSIKQNDVQVDWLYKLEDLPEVKRVKVGKKDILDSSEVDAFFLEKLTELAEKVNGAPKAESRPVAPEKTQQNPIPPQSQDDLDEIF